MPRTTDPPPLPHGYPLSALFLLVAVCASVLALTTLVLREPRRLDEHLLPILVSAGVGAISLMVLGMIVGLSHFYRIRGMAWGAVVGCLLGLFFGPTLFIAAADFPWVLGTSLAGAVLVVGTGALIRLLTGRADDLASSDVDRATSVVRQRHPLDPDPDDG